MYYLLQVVLLTLTGFVEWVSTNHVVMNNGRLLQILCILLEDEAFQLPAAECLLQVVNRKGSVSYYDLTIRKFGTKIGKYNWCNVNKRRAVVMWPGS